MPPLPTLPPLPHRCAADAIEACLAALVAGEVAP